MLPALCDPLEGYDFHMEDRKNLLLRSFNAPNTWVANALVQAMTDPEASARLVNPDSVAVFGQPFADQLALGASHAISHHLCSRNRLAPLEQKENSPNPCGSDYSLDEPSAMVVSRSGDS